VPALDERPGRGQATARMLTGRVTFASSTEGVLHRGPGAPTGNEYLYRSSTDEHRDHGERRVKKSSPPVPTASTPWPTSTRPRWNSSHHHSQLLDTWSRRASSPRAALPGTVTYHDPCYWAATTGVRRARSSSTPSRRHPDRDAAVGRRLLLRAGGPGCGWRRTSASGQHGAHEEAIGTGPRGSTACPTA